MLVFAGGIGENADKIRSEICKGMEFIGLELDEKINKGLRGKEQLISKDSSRIKVMIVPTNEELVIAQDTLEIVDEFKKNK